MSYNEIAIQIKLFLMEELNVKALSNVTMLSEKETEVIAGGAKLAKTAGYVMTSAGAIMMVGGIVCPIGFNIAQQVFTHKSRKALESGDTDAAKKYLDKSTICTKITYGTACGFVAGIGMIGGGLSMLAQ